MKLSLPVMGNTARHLIGFSNGVFDTRTGDFREHDKNDWLLIASELPFTPPAEGETLATHAPNFWKWLRRSVAENDRKADRVLALVVVHSFRVVISILYTCGCQLLTDAFDHHLIEVSGLVYTR